MALKKKSWLQEGATPNTWLYPEEEAQDSCLNLHFVPEFKMEDKTITCINCGSNFVFTIAEQQRFAASGFDLPRRCKDCRKKKVKGGPSSPQNKKRSKRRQAKHEWEYISDL